MSHDDHLDRNDKGKRIIPYTQTNSFFYIEDSAEPLEFDTGEPLIDPSKVNPQPQGGNTPEDDCDLMKRLRKSIKNL